MFRWYQLSGVCYAYFADVESEARLGPIVLRTGLAAARWFTRGWTLQELLAPREMVLYAQDWTRIGTRYDFRYILNDITAIEVKYLCGDEPLERASVSKRMSWASKRNTSRIEDTAYSLLGIFDVNIPLLYGEGKKAFRRLQEEIMKANPTDHSLLAWGTIVRMPKRQVEDDLQLKGLKPIPWNQDEASGTLQGLFAESPRDFQHSANISPWRATEGFYSSSMRGSKSLASVRYPTISGPGVMLELPVLESTALSAHHWLQPQVTQLRPLMFAILLCGPGTSPTSPIILPLYPWGYERLGRTSEVMLIREEGRNLADYIRMRQFLRIEPQIHQPPQQRDFLVRRWGSTRSYEISMFNTDGRVFSIISEGIVTVPVTVFTETLWCLCCRLTKSNTNLGFGIVFGRGNPDGTPLGPVMVSLIPLLVDEPKTKDFITVDGFTWIHKSRLAGSFSSLFERRMKFPGDIWRLDVAPFPLVEVRVNRMECGPRPTDLFDMVDITILARDARRGGKATSSHLESSL